MGWGRFDDLLVTPDPNYILLECMSLYSTAWSCIRICYSFCFLAPGSDRRRVRPFVFYNPGYSFLATGIACSTAVHTSATATTLAVLAEDLHSFSRAIYMFVFSFTAILIRNSTTQQCLADGAAIYYTFNAPNLNCLTESMCMHVASIFFCKLRELREWGLRWFRVVWCVAKLVILKFNL